MAPDPPLLPLSDLQAIECMYNNFSRFNGSRAILSGPAGGVVGYALTTYNQDTKQAVIGFDMGGT